jgi:hypothetical protein
MSAEPREFQDLNDPKTVALVIGVFCPLQRTSDKWQRTNDEGQRTSEGQLITDSVPSSLP